DSFSLWQSTSNENILRPSTKGTQSIAWGNAPGLKNVGQSAQNFHEITDCHMMARGDTNHGNAIHFPCSKPISKPHYFFP
ncbi:MAG: hypothetical protein ACFCUU_11405, partial [Cyclobacteriaceae bacterium]